MAENILKSWKEQANDIFARQPDDRRAFDDDRVKNICFMLENLPTGKLIVEWIRDNDIDVWLDYQCKDDAGGYHIPGSKTVCLSAHIMDVGLVPILAHEARHAWQDSHGFMPTLHKDTATYLKQTRFIEADAAAYEVQICYEMKQQNIDITLSQFQEFCFELQKKGEKTLPDFMNGKDILWSGFCGFFADRIKKDFYDSGSLAVGELLAGTKDTGSFRIKTEYSSLDYRKPECYGVDVVSHDNFIKLGDMFGAGNYLKDIPVKFLEDAQFIGNLSQLNSKRLMSLERYEVPVKTYRKIPTVI